MKSQSTTDPSRRLRSIRYFSLALIVAGLMSSSAYALDLLGPPGCNLYKGESEAGIEILSPHYQHNRDGEETTVPELYPMKKQDKE